MTDEVRRALAVLPDWCLLAICDHHLDRCPLNDVEHIDAAPACLLAELDTNAPIIMDDEERDMVWHLRDALDGAP